MWGFWRFKLTVDVCAGLGLGLGLGFVWGLGKDYCALKSGRFGDYLLSTSVWNSAVSCIINVPRESVHLYLYI